MGEIAGGEDYRRIAEGGDHGGGGGGGEIGEGDHSGERCKEKEEGWEEEGIAGRGNPDGE